MKSRTTWILALLLAFGPAVYAAESPKKAAKAEPAKAAGAEKESNDKALAEGEISSDHAAVPANSKNQPIPDGPKKVLLVPQSYKQVVSGKDTLTVEYEKLHPKEKFPIVRIQGIQFNLRQRGETTEFTWSGEGYSLAWPKGDTENVVFTTSGTFEAEAAFGPEKKDSQKALVKEGLIVQTKRQDGKTSKLEVTGVEKEGEAVTKFSIKTYADEQVAADSQSENHIPAPEVKKQYEKAINGEILYIFTSDKDGKVWVYWR